jgi:hypothetical protein
VQSDGAISDFFTQSLNDWPVQPIFAATDVIAAHRERCSCS